MDTKQYPPLIVKLEAEEEEEEDNVQLGGKTTARRQCHGCEEAQGNLEAHSCQGFGSQGISLWDYLDSITLPDLSQ